MKQNNSTELWAYPFQFIYHTNGTNIAKTRLNNFPVSFLEIPSFLRKFPQLLAHELVMVYVLDLTQKPVRGFDLRTGSVSTSTAEAKSVLLFVPK